MNTFHLRTIRQRIVPLWCMVLSLPMMLNSHIARSDWPGLLGPNRDGHASSDASLPAKISGPPKIVWQVEAGQGFAGAAIAGQNVALFDRVGDKDRVRWVDAKSGKEVWRRELKASYRGGINPDAGPRCVPTITENAILLCAASGDVTLLARADGAVLWSVSLRKQYSAEDGYFGAGSTPLVIDDRVVVNVGGKAVSVVCLSLKDGKPIWTASQGEASYASPIVVRSGDSSTNAKPIVVVPTRLTTVGLDVETGKELWKIPFGQRGPTVNAATPIVLMDNKIFLTSSYGIGSITLRLTTSNALIQSRDSKIASQYATPIIAHNKIFGCDGREDGGPAIYRCLNAEDESLLWEKQNMPICHTIGIGNQVLICGIDGHLWNIDAGASAFQPLWESNLPEGIYRAVPAFSDNRLFTRSSEGRSVWYCFEFM
ncbi:MAG: PQQ-binding-like beta-propeller repeat protein [Pirellula sp.]